MTADAPPRRLAVVAAAAALLALTALAFAGVVDLGFIGLDDPQYVAANDAVRGGLSAEGLGYALTSFDMGNWHPLTWLSHMAVVEVAGVEPWAHHLANLLLHAGAAVLLLTVLWRTTGRLPAAALVAALFAVHPLRVESVAWVAERKDVLGAMFWFVALHAWVSWVRRPTRARYALVLAAFTAGLMSKPMLVTVPLTLLLLDAWPLRRWRKTAAAGGLGAAALVREKLPLLALSLAAGVVTIVAQHAAGSLRPGEHIDLLMRLANAVRACGVYLGQTAWPVDLAVFYPYPSRIPWGEVALAAAAMAGLTAVAWVWRRRQPVAAVGWLWFLVTVAPVLGVLQVGAQAHADRYTHVPQVGLLLALVFAVDGLLPPARRGWRAVLAVAVLMPCVLLTRRQVERWHDDASLFGHAAAVTAGNYLAHDYHGRALLTGGRTAEAIAALRAAVAARPDYASAHNNLGQALERSGELEHAAASYRRAVELEPGLVAVRANLGAVLARLGRHDQAAQVLGDGLALDPAHVGLRMNAALNELARGGAAAAVAHFSAAVDSDASVMAHAQSLTFAWILATHPDPAVRDGALAVRVAETAARVASDAAAALEVLAAAYAEVGRFAEARRAAERALEVAQGERAVRLRRALQGYARGRPFRIGS